MSSYKLHSLQVIISHSKIVQSWKTEAERRVFFDKYAASKGMDPRNPDFWSSVAVQDLHRYQPVYFPPHLLFISSHFISFISFYYLFIYYLLQGYKTVARYHGGRLSTCLMQLYPDIGLTKAHFSIGMCSFPGSVTLSPNNNQFT